MKQKGVFPQKYMDSCDRFEAMKPPSSKTFYSTMSLKVASEKDHEYAHKVSNSIFYCWQIYSRPLEIHVSSTTG